MSNKGFPNASIDFPSEDQCAVVEKTIGLVKEKAWTFGDALRNVAKVLVGLGAVSPTVIGYSAVETGEEYRQKPDDDEVAAESQQGGKPRFRDHIVPGDDSSLVYHQVEEEGTSHGFVEALTKDKEERKSLVSARSWEEIEDEDVNENRK